MDGFVAADAQNRRSEYLLGRCIHNYLHETLGFAFFHGASNFSHGPLTEERAATALPHFRLGHPGASQRRVDAQPVSKNAIAHPPWIIIQKIRRDNFEIVVRRVRESAL